MKMIERGTCLRFRKRSSEPDYLQFYYGPACFGPVGRQGGGNRISLGPRCWYSYTAAHEVMHSLGFWHEQMRPDRDQYVSIRLENVEPAQRYNFEKMDASKWDSFGEAYDVKSVMQYPGDAFSYNGQPTIIDRQTGRAVPWNTKVSQSDYAQLNAMYPCEDPGLGDDSSDSDDSDIVEDPDC